MVTAASQSASSCIFLSLHTAALWSRKGFIVINPLGKLMRLKGTKAIAMEITIEHVMVTIAKEEIPK